jgi:glycosyltransferase involved in cell wall biosynthesis
MPLHNKGQHVRRAVDSVRQQTAGFCRLIVIDDASSDGGAETVRAIGDSRIELLARSVPGPGGYAARNLGIRAATTEWIAFLDADDEWLPDFTASIGSLIEDYGDRVGCAFTSYTLRDPDGRLRQAAFTGTAEGQRRGVLDFDHYLAAWLRHGDSPIWTGACAFRRDVLLRAGLFPEGRCRRGGDKDLWLRALELAPAAFDSRPAAIYHRDSTNMVTSTVRPDAAHCIVETIGAMIPRHTGSTRRRLMKLSNMETFTYAIAAARANRLNDSVYRVFYGKVLDLSYYLIRCLQVLPGPLASTVGKALQRFRDARFARA